VRAITFTSVSTLIGILEDLTVFPEAPYKTIFFAEETSGSVPSVV
jgi:hypothetical protein